MFFEDMMPFGMIIVIINDFTFAIITPKVYEA
jgi:hypothetical protein